MTKDIICDCDCRQDTFKGAFAFQFRVIALLSATEIPFYLLTKKKLRKRGESLFLSLSQSEEDIVKVRESTVHKAYQHEGKDGSCC